MSALPPIPPSGDAGPNTPPTPAITPPFDEGQRARRMVRSITGLALALGSMLLFVIVGWVSVLVGVQILGNYDYQRGPILAAIMALVPAGVAAAIAIRALLTAVRLPRGTRAGSLAWSIVATAFSAYVFLALFLAVVRGIVA